MPLFIRYFYFLVFGFVISQSEVDALEISEESKRVLLICSYDAAFPTYPHKIEGLRSVLDKSKYEIDVEFIDSKRIPGAETLELFSEALRYKLARLAPYDLVISADDNALKVLEEKGDAFFPGLPVVFLGVNDTQRGLALGKKVNITGVLERASFQENLDLMHRVYPHARSFYVIYDGMPTSQADWNTLQTECRIPEGVSLKPLDLSELSFEAMQRKLRELSKDDPVLLISAFIDAEGSVLTFDRSVSQIVAHSIAPIFHPYEHGIGDGLLGGMVVSHYAQARSAAQIALRVFEGESIDSIPVIEDSPNRYVIDYEQMLEQGLEKANFPRGTFYVNPHLSFWVVYRFWIIVTLCSAFVLFCIAASFFALWRRQKKISQALRESEMRNGTLFSNPFAAMLVIYPPTGRIVNANEAASEFYGYTKEELKQLTICELNVLSSAEIENSMSHAQKGDGNSFQFQHRLKSGEIRSVEVSSGPVVLNNEQHLFSIIKDRTDEIAWEQTLLKAKEAAEKANEAKDEFLSMMSHEMRTPLNPIIGFSDLLITTAEDEDSREQLSMIKVSALRLQKVIDDVLEFRKLSEKSYQVKNCDFRLSELVSGLLAMYHLPQSGNRLLVEAFEAERALPVSPDLILCGAADFLDHILSNLLGNAFKYTQNGTVYFRAGICSEESDRVQLLIEVEDTGEGIPEEKLKTIFEPFNQVDNSFTRVHEGVGLGLAICLKLADLMGAELTVVSEEGKGACFALRTWIARSKSKKTEKAP